jgi:chromatin remodeling complex protein RSC6
MMKLTDAFRNSTNASNTSVTAISKRSKNTNKSSPATYKVRVSAVVALRIIFRTVSNSDTVEENATVQTDSGGMPGLLCSRTTY